MTISGWMSDNFIEFFGAITGIIYVILEVNQNKWLWPVGIVTSAVYISVFFTNRFYADMSLQGYYLVISCIGWYWWTKGTRVLRSFSEGGGLRAEGEGESGRKGEERRGDWENGREERKGDWEKGREGEEGIKGDQDKEKNSFNTVFCIYYFVRIDVAYPLNTDRFSGTRMGFVYYITINCCNIHAGP